MVVKDRNILDKFCIDFCSILDKHVKYIVVSGFVVIASGRTRGTEDIDVIIEKIDNLRFYVYNLMTQMKFMITSKIIQAYAILIRISPSHKWSLNLQRIVLIITS